MQIGVARTCITPPWGVELAGWGYYLQRTWQRIRDHTAATALVIDDGSRAVALIAVDLMYIDADFVTGIRQRVSEETGLLPEAILVGCSHSHSSPTAAYVLGVGVRDEEYIKAAQRQAATAAILAWKKRQPGSLQVGKADISGWTYNRTRENGPVDTQMGVWRADDADGRPIAAVVNYAGHPTIMMALGSSDLSRDVSGQITDILEAAMPGLMALCFQGAAGDVNFEQHRSGNLRSAHEPGRFLAGRALEAIAAARPIEEGEVGFSRSEVVLPTRRWTDEEIGRDREEGEFRLKTGDVTGWREHIGRVMVTQPDLFPNRYGGDERAAVHAISRFALEWTDAILKDIDSRPESISTETQAIRVGDACLVSNPAELFTSFSLAVRRAWPSENLLMIGYANDSIGYLPDRHDIEIKSYAANQSPKFKNQFPFLPEAGDVMVQAMLDDLESVG